MSFGEVLDNYGIHILKDYSLASFLGKSLKNPFIKAKISVH